MTRVMFSDGSKGEGGGEKVPGNALVRKLFISCLSTRFVVSQRTVQRTFNFQAVIGWFWPGWRALKV